MSTPSEHHLEVPGGSVYYEVRGIGSTSACDRPADDQWWVRTAGRTCWQRTTPW